MLAQALVHHAATLVTTTAWEGQPPQRLGSALYPLEAVAVAGTATAHQAVVLAPPVLAQVVDVAATAAAAAARAAAVAGDVSGGRVVAPSLRASLRWCDRGSRQCSSLPT